MIRPLRAGRVRYNRRMAAGRLEQLQSINAELAASLGQCGRGEIPDVARLTALISQGGMLLEEGHSETNPAWQTQVEEYHQTLLKMKIAMEKLASELGDRKDELRAGGEQLRGFSSWVDALKGTR